MCLEVFCLTPFPYDHNLNALEVNKSVRHEMESAYVYFYLILDSFFTLWHICDHYGLI